MSWRTAASALLIVVCCPQLASADAVARIEERRSGEDNALSLHLLSLGGRTIAIEYERRLVAPHWSLVGSIGVRQNASGDYSATSQALSVELRYWRRATLRGAYAGVALRLAATQTRDELDDRSLGTMFTIAEGAAIGYRFVPWRGFELTPSAGIALRTELDSSGRLPPWTRGALSAGLTAGWLF